MKPKKRVLVVHPHVSPVGGGNGVAAWTLQALRESFDVSLATMEPPDYDALNRNWGTSLRCGDFSVLCAPQGYRRLLQSFPTPGALFEICLMMRLARDLDRRHRFDVLISTHNEADFGRRGIAYVHFPWAYLPRPDQEMRWFHRIPGLLWTYRSACRAISGGTNAGLRRNLLIANSAYVAERIRAVHGTDAIVVSPPVTSEFPNTPWNRRQPAIVGVGRLHGCKRWELAVEIVEEVRRRGHELALTLVGHQDDPEYEERLLRLAATRPWFQIHKNLTREELQARVASHRYGIHTMDGEHFGMGPAEILTAGCLLFAHNSGGPIEILGGESRLLFDDAAQAAERICAVLTNSGLEDELRGRLRERRRLFTSETFCASMRRIVEEFE